MFTLPDFHDDFHGSALAHAALAVLQALDCPIGGGWGNRDEEEGGDGGLRAGMREKEEERR